MSERIATPQATEPHSDAKERAVRVESAERQADLDGVIEIVNPVPRHEAEATDVEERLANARADFDDFKESYDTEDLFDPEKREAKSARNKSVDDYLNREKREDTTEKPYSDMTTYELVTKYVDAKANNDKTTIGDIEDEVNERAITKQDSVADRKEKQSVHDNSRKGGDLPDDDKLGHEAGGSYIDGFFEQVERRGNSVKVEDKAEPSEKESRAERLGRLREEAAQLDAERIRGNQKDGDKERLQEIDDQILREIMDVYGTDDPEDPRVKAAIEFIEEEATRRTQEILGEGDEEKSKKTKRVFDITTDPEEAKAYWEANLKDQGIALEDYLASESAWGIHRDVEVEEPPVVKPPVEEPPVDEPPVVDPPTTPIPIVPPVPPRTPERPDRVRQPGKVRRWLGRGALALLTLAGGYTAGRAHENYIVKSHDTPSVDEINKFQDHTRGVDEATQENMVRNFDSAEQFFKNISTETGAKNFEKMQKRFDKEVKHYVSTGMSEKQAKQLVEAEMKQYFAALDTAAARDNK